jgi:hypothetical protein
VADIKVTMYPSDLIVAIVDYLDLEVRKDQKLKITIESNKGDEKVEIPFETIKVFVEAEN